MRQTVWDRLETVTERLRQTHDLEAMGHALLDLFEAAEKAWRDQRLTVWEGIVLGRKLVTVFIATKRAVDIDTAED